MNVKICSLGLLQGEGYRQSVATKATSSLICKTSKQVEPDRARCQTQAVGIQDLILGNRYVNGKLPFFRLIANQIHRSWTGGDRDPVSLLVR